MNLLENMVLKTKLMVLTGFMLSVIALLGFMSYTNLKQWQDSVYEIGIVRVPSLLGLMDMRAGSVRVALQENRIRGLINHPDRMRKTEDASVKIDEAWALFQKGYDLYAPLPQTPEEAIEWKEYENALNEWKKLAKSFEQEIVHPLTKTNDPEAVARYYDAITKYIESSEPVRLKAGKHLDKIIQINADVSNETVKESQEESSSDLKLSTTIISVSFILAILLATLIIRSVNRSISMSVSTIRDGAMQITSASGEVASASSSLAQGASEQASSVEEVSATLEASTSINAQNTDNARQADILAKNANDAAKSGYERGEKLSSSMHAITESAAKISGIIKAIDQIAFQTNLLALNAAVEAARAGEHGLGFAVVADEVRNLAQRAAAAAKETSDIIEEVLVQIKEGNDIALSTHDAFKEIVEHSKKVSDLIGEISQAGKEQSEGMKQINQAMGQVDQVTQQVAANSEEAAAAAEELNAQAVAMMDTVSVLAKMVGMENNNISHDFKSTPSKSRQIVSEKKVAISMKPKPQTKNSGLESKAKEIFPLTDDDLKEF